MAVTSSKASSLTPPTLTFSKIVQTASRPLSLESLMIGISYFCTGLSTACLKRLSSSWTSSLPCQKSLQP